MDVLDLYSSPPCYKAPPIKDQYYPCNKVPPIKDQYYPCYKVLPIKDQYYLLGLITFKCNRLHYNYFAIFMITECIISVQVRSEFGKFAYTTICMRKVYTLIW
jgi:hypothetical protein